MTNWVVYLLRCCDGSLYCGASNDVKKRVFAHNAGRGAKYTRSRLPVALEIVRNGFTKSDALKLEAKVKKQPKQNKRAFLASWSNP